MMPKRVKHLEQQLKSSSASWELSSGHKSSDQDDCARHQKRLGEQQSESQDGKSTKTYPEGVQGFILTLYKDNKILKKQVEDLKAKCLQLSGGQETSTKEEINQNTDELVREMTEEKDSLIAELKNKIEELTTVVNEKECMLQDLEQKIENNVLKEHEDLKTLVESFNLCENEKGALSKELEEKNKEVESLQKELKKKTYNLQGLVNTELWNKNREIEKLNKLCERKHLEILSLQKQLRERSLLLQDKVSGFVAPVNLPSGIFGEGKENMQPFSDLTVQLQNLNEEKRLLLRKVEELQARLLNTPERDTESQLMQTLRAEKEEAEKQRKEAMNACVLLTTRLQELADFLDSLLPSLCGKKRRVVQQAVERSRELSRSLSLAAEESTLQSLQCSTWTDLQPSLYLPLLPDISTVDFWSGDESQAEALLGAEDNTTQTERVEEQPKQADLSVQLHLEKTSEKTFLKSVFDFDQHLRDIIVNDVLIDETGIGNLTEGSLLDTGSELKNVEQSISSKISLEAKSANIGKITLTSRKKDTKCSQTNPIDNSTRLKEKEGDFSENDAWSEPDRDVSYARMGIKEESSNIKSLQFNCNDTSETVDSAPKSPSSRKTSEIQRLQRKIRSLEQVNDALRSELVILHKLAPASPNRQDKATSIEISRQNVLSIPSHLLEEIKNQREKLEASLFHNDYIRRQLENTVSTLRKGQGDDQEKATLILRLKEVTSQLEAAECELSKMKLEKDGWARKVEILQTTLEQTSGELVDKQCALIDLERKTTQRLKEEEERFSKKCSLSEQRYLELEQKWMGLQRERDQLLEKIADNKQQIVKLKSDVQYYEQEGNKNKQVQEELNLKIQQAFQQKDELQRVVGEQEQLLADAERERAELATQLIARDRQVSELQARLSRVELTSGELETALRAQLDLVTQQCGQYEARIRDLDHSTKREEGAAVELRSRLDAARYAHSEAVLQYTRVANENIRLQQELRRRQHEPHQVEMIKIELERRVAELEAVNGELQSKLTSLDVKPPYSDYETDAGSSVAGSPRRPPLPLTVSPHRPALAISPHHYVAQRSQDLTSDYLSDQEPPLSSPQSQSRNIWFPTSHSQASASPDLGIESDHGRFSSLETQATKSTAISLRGTPVKDLMKLEEENSQLRRNLQKTRLALEKTLSQLTSANQHKQQYEAQLSAANQQKAKVERAICRQITKTQSILKKAKVNLEEDWNNKNH